ncbi:MATE family efflux transporter [Fusibacter sp. 3D3]|uniref:MATE family efflux transporter n=1 Tax=Fusibacter sp. 3D3 TaxID=1048380 RepID=UPI000852D8D2|nr:MATE family efflux transporter [Fusibacter sp. 3D3]GAU80066.1 multi antimicrobial extrusion protein Na(+)/drug antiporter [Fusibacter sp. 3D3]
MSKFVPFIKEKKILIITILSLSLPAIIEMGLNTLLGVADLIMLGQLIGSDAIASVGFSNQIMYLLIFTFSAFNTGAIAMISRAFGEKNYEKLKNIAEQNVILNLLIGFIILVISYAFRNQIFTIYDIEPAIFSDSVTYFTVILLGFVPMFLSFSFAAILRGSGDTKTPMKITAFVNILNVIGNYFLITGWGPFPELGIAGAALSTSLSRLVAVIIYIHHLYFKAHHFKLQFKIVMDSKILNPLFRISLPGGAEQALMQLAFVVVGIFIAKLETSSEALFRILNQIESLSFMPAVGFSIATATLVGKSLGEKDTKGASEVGYTASILGMTWGFLSALLFITLPGTLIAFFTPEMEIIMLGIPVMPFLAINQPGLNFMIVMSGALRGAGDTMKVMIYTIARLWLCFVPLSYVFILHLGHGVAGLWHAEIISILLFTSALLLRFKSKKWAEIRIG